MTETSEPSDDETRATIGFLPYWMPGDAKTWLTALLRDAAIQGWDVDECGRRATGLLEDWRKENPTPRVFFPGDTVPAGTYLLNDGGGVLMPRDEPWEVPGRRVYIELRVPVSGRLAGRCRPGSC